MICSGNMKKVNYKSFGLFVVVFSVSLTGFSQQNLVPQPLPCLLINSQNAPSLNGLYTNQKCIEVGGEATETAINVYGNNQINLKAGKEIHVAPNTSVKPYGNGQVHAYIATDPVEVVWFEPNSTPGFVGKFNRLELGFRLPAAVNQQVTNFITNGAGGINPFDPDQIDFRVNLTAPDGSTLTRFAFYYKPYNENLSGSSANPATIQNDFVQDTTSYPWRFRFAPPNEGLWKISIEIIITQSGATQTINESGITFVCVPSTHQGTLKVSHQTGSGGDNNKDRWMYYSVTNAPFFAISENLANAGEGHYVPSVNRRHLAGLQKLIDAGGNFTRFELGGQNALPDWDVYNNYNTKMDEMYAFDRMVNKCEDNDIYFTLFRHHVEVENRDDWAIARWQNNPYNMSFGDNIYAYFTSTDIIKNQKKTLRYIFSRWGYSPNMAIYGYSEVNSWYKKLIEEESLNLQEAMATIKNWIELQQVYIKNTLNNNTLFSHSYSIIPEDELSNNAYIQDYISIFQICDIIGLHNYGLDKNRNFKHRYDQIEKYWNHYSKPIMMEEIGLDPPAMYCCTGIDYHNNLWSTAMMGDFGAGMDWWWDRGTFDNNYQVDLSLLKTFFQDENLRFGNFEPQKWDDAINWENRKLENFALVQGNKERVVGWIHNATYYWRNLAAEGNCIQNLVDNNYSLNSECHVALDPYGIPVSYNPWESYYPRPFHEMYDPLVEHIINGYNNDDYKDHFTENGGVYPINYQTPFEIKNLKSTLALFKRHWYQIDFFGTNGTIFAPVPAQVIHTNLNGNLHPYVQNLDVLNPDYAYKVTYLGHYKSKVMNVDTINYLENDHLLNIRVNTQCLINISPNPNNGDFTINSSDMIGCINVFNEKGENVLNKSNVNALIYEVKLNLLPGIYLVQIQTQNNSYINKKIIIL